MTEPYVDTKATCTKCSATFTMRLEQDTPFACDKCGRWQQAKFPCPLCGGRTVHFTREGNSWVQLPDPKHDEPEAEPETEEPNPEPEAESEEQPEQ